MYVIARTCRALEFTVLRRYRRSAIKQRVCTLTIAAPRFVLTIHIPYPLRGNYTFLINRGILIIDGNGPDAVEGIER